VSSERVKETTKVFCFFPENLEENAREPRQLHTATSQAANAGTALETGGEGERDRDRRESLQYS